MERNRESLHRDGWKKPKESAGSVLKTKPYLMMNDKGRSRDTKEHRYSTFERIFFILLFFLFSFFLLEKQLVTPEDHWKLIGLYRVTAQKGGDPTCNGLKRCLEDVDSLQQLRRMCMALQKKKTSRRILRYSWKQYPCMHPVLSRVISLVHLLFLSQFLSPNFYFLHYSFVIIVKTNNILIPSIY